MRRAGQGKREVFRRVFAQQHGLRPIAEVTAEWNRRSGDKPITRGRVLQVLKMAEAKIAAAMVDEVLGGRSVRFDQEMECPC